METSTITTPSTPPQAPWRVSIQFCTKCRWLLRAAWLAQELLTTFEQDLQEVALCPAESGTFDVFLNGILLFSRAEQQRFPEPREIKQAIRDTIDPQRSLGHSDRTSP